MIKSPLAKIFTVKVLGLAAACGTAGGVALAANAGAFSTDAHVTPSAHAPAAVAVGAPAQARPGAAGTGRTPGTLAAGTGQRAGKGACRSCSCSDGDCRECSGDGGSGHQLVRSHHRDFCLLRAYWAPDWTKSTLHRLPIN